MNVACSHAGVGIVAPSVCAVVCLLNSSVYSAVTAAVELGKNHCCASCVVDVDLF